jgi:hypothetical protein
VSDSSTPSWPGVTLGVTLGRDPAIGYPHQFANGAIPVSNHPMEMAGSSSRSSPALMGLESQSFRCLV